jgi:hypothetical protein
VSLKYNNDSENEGERMDQIYDVEKATVFEKLNALGDEERMILLNKYTRQTEDIYCTFSEKANMWFC